MQELQMKITINQLRRLIQEVVEDVAASAATQKYIDDKEYISSNAARLAADYKSQGYEYVPGADGAYKKLTSFVNMNNPGDPNNSSIIEKIAQDAELAASAAMHAAKKHGYRSRRIPGL
jgi:hypothetical protein